MFPVKQRSIWKRLLSSNQKFYEFGYFVNELPLHNLLDISLQFARKYTCKGLTVLEPKQNQRVANTLNI